MTAIAGTRRQFKEMADGTIRVSVDIDPKYRADFFTLFSAVDMPVALAPLVADFERQDTIAPPAAKTKEPNEKKLGELCRWAVMRCKEGDFINWFLKPGEVVEYQSAKPPLGFEAQARQKILNICGIKSRTELDSNPDAAALFHKLIRMPYSERAQ